jgi:TIR domain/Effector-associated domain 11
MLNIKGLLQKQIAEDTEKALDLTLQIVKLNLDRGVSSTGTLDYNELISQKGRYLTILQEHREGVITREVREAEKNKVRLLLLNWMDTLPLSFFELPNEKEDLILGLLKKADTISEKASNIAQNSQFEFDVFLSFSSKNIIEAREVVDKLRGYGLRVFFSDESLRNKAGESFNTVISKALTTSNHFVWLCTPESVGSSWVTMEHESFFGQIYMNDRSNRRFFILKGMRFSEGLLPITYRSLQFADEPEQIIQNIPSLSKENVPVKVDTTLNDPPTVAKTKDTIYTTKPPKTEPVKPTKSDLEKQLEVKRQAELSKLDEEADAKKKRDAQRRRLAAEKEKKEQEEHNARMAALLNEANDTSNVARDYTIIGVIVVVMCIIMYFVNGWLFQLIDSIFRAIFG